MNNFDLKNWQSIFPWESIREHAYRSGTHVTSPVHLVMVENQRAEIADELSRLHHIPSEVFTFSIGEPEDPTATKIGGVPFRQRDKPWPQYSGYDYRFLAQFNFRHSRDLVGETPEELLLIFASEDFCDIHLEWTSLEIDPLPRGADIPSPEPMVNCHAIPYRTIDYYDPSHNPCYKLTALAANKIGGIPCEVKGEIAEGCFCKEVDFDDDSDEPIMGRHLCTLSSLQTSPNFKYPWCNQQATYGFEHYNDPDKSLSIVDMGSISIYITDEEETYSFLTYH